MTPEEYHYKTNIEGVNFVADRDEDPDYMVFTIEGKDLYAKCRLHMYDVIDLKKELRKQLEDWLGS